MGLLELSDGQLVSYSSDKTIRLWSTTTGQRNHVLQGHTDHIIGLLELSDGQLVSYSWINKIRIWNTATGQCNTILYGFTIRNLRRNNDLIKLNETKNASNIKSFTNEY